MLFRSQYRTVVSQSFSNKAVDIVRFLNDVFNEINPVNCESGVHRSQHQDSETCMRERFSNEAVYRDSSATEAV